MSDMFGRVARLGSSRRLDRAGLATYAPLILCVVVMIPRLVSAQFGFFDDPSTLLTSERILHGEWSPGEEAGGGRFRPVYWLYYAAIYALAGRNPWVFFLGNLLLLMLATGLLIAVARRRGISRLGAAIAGTTFVLAGPTWENIYTLSKPELPQLVWLLSSVALLVRRPVRHRPFRIGMAAVCVLLAAATKETAILMPALAFGWLLIEEVARRRAGSRLRESASPAGDLLLASALGIAAYLALRQAYLPFGLTERGYSSRFALDLGRITRNARVWADLLIRDDLYLVPALIPPAYAALRMRDSRRIAIYLKILAWMGAWIALYLPWPFTQEYYLLPFAAGAAFLGGMLLDDLRLLLASNRLSARAAGWASASLAAGLFLLALPGFITNARFQLAMDEANMAMLEYVVQEAPPGAEVYINIQQRNEYVDRTTTWIREIYARRDLRVDYFRPDKAAWIETGEGSVIMIAPVFRNQFYPSVRVGVYEHTSRRWNQAMHELLGNRLREIHREERSLTAWIIDAPRLICPLLGEIDYCRVPNAPLDHRRVVYGWVAYEVVTD